MPKLAKHCLTFLDTVGISKVKSHHDPHRKLSTITDKFLEYLKSKSDNLNTIAANLRDFRKHLKEMGLSDTVIQATFRPDITKAMNKERERALEERNKTPVHVPTDFSNLDSFIEMVKLFAEHEGVFYNDDLKYDAMMHLQVALCMRQGEFMTLKLHPGEGSDAVLVSGHLKQGNGATEALVPLVTAAMEDDATALWLQWNSLPLLHKKMLLKKTAYPEFVKASYGFTTHTLRKIGGNLAILAHEAQTELQRYMVLSSALRHKSQPPVSLTAYGNISS